MALIFAVASAASSSLSLLSSRCRLLLVPLVTRICELSLLNISPHGLSSLQSTFQWTLSSFPHPSFMEAEQDDDFFQSACYPFLMQLCKKCYGMRMHFCCLVFNTVSPAVSAGCCPQPVLLCGVILPQVQKWEPLLMEPHKAPVGPVSLSIHGIQSGSSDMLLNHFPPS